MPLASCSLMGVSFASAMEMTLRETFATPGGYSTLTRRRFEEMSTAKSNAAVVASVVERAERLPRSLGEKLLLDMLRYDVGRLTTSLADLRVPVMAVQTTYSNEQRERRPMSKGQTTPYLDMLRDRIPSVRIEIIEDIGHFPQMMRAYRLIRCSTVSLPRFRPIEQTPTAPADRPASASHNPARTASPTESPHGDMLVPNRGNQTWSRSPTRI